MHVRECVVSFQLHDSSDKFFSFLLKREFFSFLRLWFTEARRTDKTVKWIARQTKASFQGTHPESQPDSFCGDRKHGWGGLINLKEEKIQEGTCMFGMHSSSILFSRSDFLTQNSNGLLNNISVKGQAFLASVSHIFSSLLIWYRKRFPEVILFSNNKAKYFVVKRLVDPPNVLVYLSLGLSYFHFYMSGSHAL